jgi:N6-L-threonylcarbamoyladenine synthase
LRAMPSARSLLAIETSCDECSASVVERGARFARVRSNVIFSQVDLHRRFGGVVPEIASRNHLEMMAPVIDEALEKAGVKLRDLDALAVTQRPGLIGALLVGVSAAKAMAYALGKPLVPVDHLSGHLHSIFIEGQPGCDALSRDHLPLLALLVSGGHTNLYLIRELPPAALGAEKLSESRDDAAGEAFDKTAKLLGLPYPGGVHLDRAAKGGDRNALKLPMPLPGRESLEFSFSGLKTAVATELKNRGYEPYGAGASWTAAPDQSKVPQGKELADFCASIQESIARILIRKVGIALRQTGARGLAVVGGVSANSRFRELLASEVKVPVFIPERDYCTDNAAMIGACGLFALERGEAVTGEQLLALNAFSS